MLFTGTKLKIIDGALHSDLLELHRRENPIRDSRQAGLTTRVRAAMKFFFSQNPPACDDSLQMFTRNRFVSMCTKSKHHHSASYKNATWNREMFIFVDHTKKLSRSQWPRGLRRRSAAARLLRLWVRIPPGAWMFTCCECCVLSGRGLCDELITRPEESYRLCCIGCG